MKTPSNQTPYLRKSRALPAATATVIASLLAIHLVSAATVTFTSPVTITSDAVLDTPLSYPGAALLQAVKWGGSATAVTTSGGAQTINFTQGTTQDLDQPGTNTNTILYNAGTQSSTSLFPGTTGNTDFDAVLRCDGWHNNASDGVRPLCLRIGGLTPGAKYLLSLFTADARSTDRSQQYFDTFAATNVFSGGSSVSFSQNPATIVIGTFTADATTQDIFVKETDTLGNDDTHLVGFTLYSVTEFAPVVGDITISPTSTAYAGEARILSATGTGPIDGYRWEWDNGTSGATFSLIIGASSNSYTQDTTGLLGAYQYRLIATNASSSATSSVATLTVDSATSPFVTVDTTPSFVTRYNGGTVTFSAAFDGNHPITNQWQVSTNGGVSWFNLAGETNTSLTLTNLQFVDAGSYRLAGTNVVGGSASSPATLDVLDVSLAKFQWSAPVPFSGVTADEILTNVPGSVVGAAVFGNTFQAVSLSDGHIINFKSDGSVATVTGLGTATGAYPAGTGLTTGNANLDAVLNQFSWDGGPKTITLYNLQVGEQYAVQLFALDNRDTGVGESNRLANFQDGSDPAISVETSATFAMGDNVYVIGTFTASSTIETIQENLPTDNDGNMNALVLRALSFVPSNQPPVVVVDPQPAPVFEGQPAEFSIVVESFETPTYQWQSNGVDVADVGVFSGATTDTLRVSDATGLDGVQFSCNVQNSAGFATSGSATLTVLALPPSSGDAAADVLALGPVAYWPLNETLDASPGTTLTYDASGNLRNGTYGSQSFNAYNGIVGPQAADGYPQFAANQGALNTTPDFSPSWVTTPPLNLNTNTATIAMWIYPDGVQPFAPGLYVNRNGGTVAGLGYYQTNRLGYKWNNDASATWSFPGPEIPTNFWSYVAVVVEPTQATLYLYNTNGLQTATNFTTHNNMSWGGSQSNIRIGSDNTVATTFNGDIDEVVVFDRALSQSELLSLVGVAGPPELSIQSWGENVVITWSAGQLLEADAVTGPWTTNLAATSPYTNTPAGTQRFFRALAP